MQSFPHDSADSYKVLARSWAATVTVVTVRRAAEHLAAGAAELDGFTATAFITVSITPPLILVSATTASNAFTMLREASSFVVNLLSPSQVDVANAFAKSAAERAGVFDRVESTRDANGVPLLSGVTGAFSAKVHQLVDAGDHTLVVGAVTAIHLGEGADTLVYHNRGYGKVARLD